MIANLGWHIWRKAFARIFVACFALLGACLPAAAERVAFVVGNSDYDAAPDLSNASNDATATVSYTHLDVYKRQGQIR